MVKTEKTTRLAPSLNVAGDQLSWCVGEDIALLREMVRHCDEVIDDSRRLRAKALERISHLTETARHAIGAQDE